MNALNPSKINWKVFAASEGYKLFKKSYATWLHYEARFPTFHQKKPKYLKLFYRIIGIAIRFGKFSDVPPEELLKYWAKEKDQNWYNYYTHILKKHKVPKANTKIGAKYSVKLLKKHGYHAQLAFEKIRDDKARVARELRKKKGKKPRWSAAKKAAAKRSKYLKQKYSGN